MEKITIDDKQIFTSITSACRKIFGCEPEMRNDRPASCFVPSRISEIYGEKYGDYRLWFANLNSNYWIDTLEENGMLIREESVKKPSPYPFHTDPKMRIVFWNFAKQGEARQYKFVGVFTNDESRTERDVNYFIRMSDCFPFEGDNYTNLRQIAGIKIIENNLQNFYAEKQFTKPGITIDEAAKMLGTNRDYLSKYINSVKNKNFNNWLNELRIEYSKELMRENPLFSLDEIAQYSGFSDRSQLSKHFTQITGAAPSVWRRSL